MTIEARTLPTGVADELRAMRANGDRRWVTMTIALRRRGYSFAAIGTAAGVSRQRVHQLVRTEERKLRQAHAPLNTDGLALPPRVNGNPPTAHKRSLPTEDLAMLKGLWSISSARRGSTPAGHPANVASESLVVLVTRLLEDGYTFEQMAEGAGLDSATFRGRMLRAGVRAREVRSA